MELKETGMYEEDVGIVVGAYYAHGMKDGGVCSFHLGIALNRLVVCSSKISPTVTSHQYTCRSTLGLPAR